MPDVTITIGRRDFTVACQDGEEHYLRTAAEMLDREASALIGQIGRLPETRMLLMAGLMLADRTAAFEERAREAEAKLAAASGEGGKSAAATEGLRLSLARLVTQAEELAETAERQTG